MNTHRIPELDAEFELWGEAPVQGLGTVKGREFYFRSRHTDWELEIAREDGMLPSDVGSEPVFLRRGKHLNASFMPHAEALTLIAALLREYCNLRFA